MTNAERRAVAALAGIFGLRMLGLFLIMPVFAVYAEQLDGTTPLLIGVALGVYGLTQALLQIPFGLASDRYGRKPVIVFGLVIFAVGSAVAALAQSIEWVIIGRALQGAGAIAAVVLALTADLTRDEQRAKALAVIGMSIGFAFMLALMVGPVFAALIGVPGIFWLTGGLALSAIAVVLGLIPTPAQATHRDVQPMPDQLASVIRDPHLWRLNLGIFVLHLVLTAMFVVVPVALVRDAGVPLGSHWKVYVPVLGLAAAAMIPFLMLSTRKQWLPRILVGAIGILFVSQISLLFGYRSFTYFVLALWLYFWGFNTLEAVLPALVSRLAPVANKGTAMGIYNSFQFVGVFLGGVVGGWVSGAYGSAAVFLVCAGLVLAWLALSVLAPLPRLWDTRLLHIGRQSPAEAQFLADRLAAIPGVLEATVIAEEGVAYLRVDGLAVDERRLREFTSSQGG